MQNISGSQASAEIPINENFIGLQHQEVYGKKPTTSTGLTWGYWGGRWGSTLIADGTLALAASSTNYITVDRSTRAISTSTSPTNWNSLLDYFRVYIVTTNASAVTATEDHRAGSFGVHGMIVGNNVTSIVPDSTDRAILLGDQQRILLHPGADTIARTWTIPANASVAFSIGTMLKFINQNGAGVLTIAIATDTMRLSPGGTTGSRTLSANGIAEAVKLTATEWIISGTGLT